MRAENGIAIDELVAQTVAGRRTDPVHHGLTQPAALEAEATHRAIVKDQKELGLGNFAKIPNGIGGVEFLGRAGHGRYVPRGLSSYLR
jgi:hypothetical protein